MFSSPTKDFDATKIISFFSFFVVADARFVASSSSTYYSDKRQIAAAQFWHFWYNQTLFSNRPNDPWSSYPRGGYGFESTPTIGWSYRTDSQLSVEESVATPVYVQPSYGKTGAPQVSIITDIDICNWSNFKEGHLLSLECIVGIVPR